MRLLRLRRTADAFLIAAVVGLLLVQIDFLPVTILGWVLAVVGVVGEVTYTLLYLVRRWGPGGSKP